MKADAVYDVEDHGQQDNSHTNGNRNDKYGVQSPYKGRLVMCSMGRSQTALIISSNPKTLPNRKPNMVEKKPQQDIIAARFIFFQPVEEEPSKQKTDSLPHIPKHKAKQEGIGEADQYGGIDLIVCRQAVHLNEHLKGFKKPWVLQLGGRLAHNLVMVILHDTESFFHR